MATGVKGLSLAALRRLRDLVQLNIDSREGFSVAADRIEDDRIAMAFRDLADERAVQAEDLQIWLSAHDEPVPQWGTLRGTAHRALLSLRSAVTSGDAYHVLDEALRGENAITELYEELLGETAGSSVSLIVTRQYARVRAARDRIEQLRNIHS